MVRQHELLAHSPKQAALETDQTAPMSSLSTEADQEIGITAASASDVSHANDNASESTREERSPSGALHDC